MEWHTEDIDAVLNELLTEPGAGLSAAEAKERSAKWGFNRLTEAPTESRLKRFALQFSQFIIIVLIAGAILAGLLGEWIDAGAILAIVLLNGIVGFLQEEKAERVMEALKQYAAPTAKVVRDGAPLTVDAYQLVPGDIVLLESGDHIPADLRIVASSTLRVNEAALTGESLPVDKRTDALPSTGPVPLGERTNVAYLGTNVVYGRGTGVVVAIGMTTEMGKIASLLQEVKREPTPLQRRLSEFARLLVYAALAVCALVFALGLMRGNDFMEMLLTAVSLAVAAIPEGLPAVVTIVLALGVQRMAGQNALVRKLPSVETLGSATVIASDKTGTLTENQMTVQRLYLPPGVPKGSLDSAPENRTVRITGAGYAPDGEFFIDDKQVSMTEGAGLPLATETTQKALRQAIEVGLMASTATVAKEKESGQWRVTGDPTEGALVTLALKAGIEKAGLLKKLRFVTEVPFDSARKMMTTVFIEREREDGEQKQHVYVKGAIERVLTLCTHTLAPDGTLAPFGKEGREAALRANEELTGRAMRVLCLAYKSIAAPTDTALTLTAEELENGLVFAGLAGMGDPPRAEVAEAVETAKRAGILPLMITGDHKSTAIAIAREIGTFTDSDIAITGTELDRMDEAEFADKLEHIKVYARVNPEHKLRVVRAWRARGDIIAMTGDGVNDAPALKEADIGIAMGITGTDVTKEAADMVLLDDNFSTIISAVEQGRGIFDNIQRVVHFLLSCNIGEVLVLLVAALVGSPLPLLPIHILWTNLVTDGLPAIGLSMEKVESGVMERAPRASTAGIVTKRLMWIMLLQGAFIAACTLAAYWIDLYWFDSGLTHARTVAFTTLVLCQKFHAFNCRSADQSIFTIGIRSNQMLNVAVVVILVSQLLLLYVPTLQHIFKLAPLHASAWAVVIVASVLPLVAGEIAKLLVRRRAQAQ